MFIILQCSSVCGAGVQTRHVICQHTSAHGRCPFQTKPIDFKPCIRAPCGNWTIGNWSEVWIVHTVPIQLSACHCLLIAVFRRVWHRSEKSDCFLYQWGLQSSQQTHSNKCVQPRAMLQVGCGAMDKGGATPRDANVLWPHNLTIVWISVVFYLMWRRSEEAYPQLCYSTVGPCDIIQALQQQYETTCLPAVSPEQLSTLYCHTSCRYCLFVLLKLSLSQLQFMINIHVLWHNCLSAVLHRQELWRLWQVSLLPDS